MSQLGKQLKELRGSLSLYEVGKACSIVPNDISRYEQGKRVPSPEILMRLAEHYEVPYLDLRLHYYEDLLSESPDYEVVLEWAKSKLMSPEQAMLLEKLNTLPREAQNALIKKLLSEMDNQQP